MEKERTLVLIKPDGVQRTITGKIISRFEDSGLKIIGMKMLWADDARSKTHYTEEIAKKYGEDVRNRLLTYIKQGPIVALVLEGVDAIKNTRKIVGATYPNESPPGTIRGDFAHISKDYANAKQIDVKNLIHASGNPQDAAHEIPIWFTDKELHSYKTIHDMVNFGE